MSVDEKCIRCGEPGPDLRTLWMACFYEMMELELPFEKLPGFTPRNVDRDMITVSQAVDAQVCEGVKIKMNAGEIIPNGVYGLREFYTLRVCKGCRGSWMGTIKQWFENAVKADGLGTGIYVRRNGTNVEISEEEWAQENPGVEPVRVPQHARK